MAVKLVVFDMAGTTVSDDNNVAEAFQKAFRDNGIEMALKDAIPLMGYHKPLAIQMLLERYRIDFDSDIIEKIHDDFENGMMDFYEYDAAVKPVRGAENVFEKLKASGIRIALNTGFSRNIADTIIQRFRWKEKGLIDDFIGSDEVEKGRPYPFMIGKLMERAGIADPLEVAKIGDTTVDIEEGQNAGCLYVMAVTTGACEPGELEKMKPTHLINDLSEIPHILAS
jgi:phosphonatase-like hydrolase